jgi:IAA-amino acid hydrolase
MMAAADKFELVVTRVRRARRAAAEHRRPDRAFGARDPRGAPGRQPPPRPDRAGVITIGTIHGGTVDNVIPDAVTMTGTIRSFTPEAREVLHTELQRAVSIVEPLGGRAT